MGYSFVPTSFMFMVFPTPKILDMTSPGSNTIRNNTGVEMSIR